MSLGAPSHPAQDALEMLEKRVKSRFSHRQVFVPPPETYADYTQALVGALTLDGKASKTVAWNAAVQVRA